MVNNLVFFMVLDSISSKTTASQKIPHLTTKNLPRDGKVNLNGGVLGLHSRINLYLATPNIGYYIIKWPKQR